jgi:hypothetical protein
MDKSFFVSRLMSGTNRSPDNKFAILYWTVIMILPLYNKWTIIINTFIGPLLTIPIALLFTYSSFTSTNTLWFFLLIVNIAIGISGLIALLVSRNAKFFFSIRILIYLGTAMPLAYAVNLLLRSYFPNTFFQIYASLIIILLVEWLISFYYEKIKLLKVLRKKMPNKMFDVASGVVDLQKPFVVAKRDTDKSGIERMLAFGRIVIFLAPVIGSYIYRSTTLVQQSNYILVVLSMLVMVLVIGSGVSGGTLSALMDIESKVNMRFVIKKLE